MRYARTFESQNNDSNTALSSEPTVFDDLNTDPKEEIMLSWLLQHTCHVDLPDIYAFKAAATEDSLLEVKTYRN